MIHEGMQALRIKANGQHVRNLLTLRLKEADRQIARVEVALENAKVDEDTIKKEVGERFSVAQARAARVMPRGVLGDHGHSVGIGEMVGIRAEVEKYTNAVEYLRFQRAQIQWLFESFIPETVYELDAGDLMTLGLSTITSGRGYVGGCGGFDPLDL